ncbi:MAG: S41 family peptidase [Planctomycetota bacterium]
MPTTPSRSGRGATAHASRRAISTIQILLVVILGVAVVGSTMAIGVRANADGYRFFDPLVDIKAQLDALYVEDIDQAALQQGAINGMLEVVGDPYTVYVPQDDTADFNKGLTGEYVGIGAEVLMPEGWLEIVSPLDGSPAWQAGVMAGDRVTHVDGESTFDLSIDQAIDRLTGEAGTPVVLTIERDGQELEITVVRDAIKVQAVRGLHRDTASEDAPWLYLLDPQRNIAYIRLTQFTPGVAGEVAQAIEAARVEAGLTEGQSLGGLVIDVRWNPGGLLDEAIAIADLFLEEGSIVSTRGRAYPERTAIAESDGTLPEFPITLLINGQSASASEVLAGALVDNGRAIAVGSRTFGKGSVQTVRPVGDGAGVLKLTEQRYYLPTGRSLHRTDDSETWGVDPSPGFFVPVEGEALSDLLRVRREEETLRTDAEAARAQRWSDPEWVLEYLRDPQLATAIRGIQSKLDTGVWAPEGALAMDPDAVDRAELRNLALARERLLRELARLQRRYDAVAGATEGELDTAEWDLWGDDAEIVGGRVTVTAPDGSVLSELDITGTNLERWLIDADLAPVQPPTAVPAPPSD